MLHATQIVTIHTPVDTIWLLISNFGAGATYLAMVTHCAIQGARSGTLRTLTYLDGSVIVERLEMIDEGSHRLNYTLVTDTLFGNCLLTMGLRALSPEWTELTWSADFQPISLPIKEALSLMEGMLIDNCQTLKQLLEG
jgi:hypothetical protein